MKKVLCSAILALGLTGCAHGPAAPFDPDAGYLVSKSTESKESSLRMADFKVSLMRFEDNRTAKSLGKLLDQDVLYEYEPDVLVTGVDVYARESMRHYFNRVGAPQAQKRYLAEVELTYLKTYILRQNFSSANFGRYVVDAEAEVIIRDESSKVLINQPVGVRLVEGRQSSSGRHPTSAQDEGHMQELVANAMKKMAIDAAWLVERHAE